MGALLSAFPRVSSESKRKFLSLTKLQIIPFFTSLVCEVAKFSLNASQQEVPVMLECLMAAMAALLMVVAIYTLSRKWAATTSGTSGGWSPPITPVIVTMMSPSPSRWTDFVFVET